MLGGCAGIWSRSLAKKVEEWSSDPTRQRALILLGGDILLDWLLDKALSAPSASQLSAEKAICHLLADGKLPPLLQALQLQLPAGRFSFAQT